MRGGARESRSSIGGPSGQPGAFWGRHSSSRYAGSLFHRALNIASAPDRQRVGKSMEQAGWRLLLRPWLHPAPTRESASHLLSWSHSGSEPRGPAQREGVGKMGSWPCRGGWNLSPRLGEPQPLASTRKPPLSLYPMPPALPPAQVSLIFF